jgi:hypothetical protein
MGWVVRRGAGAWEPWFSKTPLYKGFAMLSCYDTRRKRGHQDYHARGINAFLRCLRSTTLGGHLKTGHTWSLQNRPTDRAQDMKLFYLA